MATISIDMKPVKIHKCRPHLHEKSAENVVISLTVEAPDMSTTDWQRLAIKEAGAKLEALKAARARMVVPLTSAWARRLS